MLTYVAAAVSTRFHATVLLAVVGLLTVATSSPALPGTPTAAQLDDDRAGGPWGASGYCTLNFYNFCQGWVYVWDGWTTNDAVVFSWAQAGQDTGVNHQRCKYSQLLHFRILAGSATPVNHFFGALLFILLIDPYLAVLIGVSVPLFLLMVKVLGRQIRPVAVAMNEEYAGTFAIVEENLQLLPIIKSFTRDLSPG